MIKGSVTSQSNTLYQFHMDECLSIHVDHVFTYAKPYIFANIPSRIHTSFMYIPIYEYHSLWHVGFHTGGRVPSHPSRVELHEGHEMAGGDGT